MMTPGEFAVALSGPPRTNKVVVDLKETHALLQRIIDLAQHDFLTTADTLGDKLMQIALLAEVFGKELTDRREAAIAHEFTKPEGERQWEPMVAMDDGRLIPIPSVK